MKNQLPQKIAILGFIGLISIGYFLGLSGVPFHPDEQTYLFMSGDVERFFRNPSQLFWNPAHSADLRQKYRLRDAPLSRWLIGIGRQIARKPAPQVDWDWSKDWQANEANGALPSPDLLLVGRWSVAFLFPLSLWLMFQVAQEAGGVLSGWLAMLLLAGNALILLHTRRAMAESSLLFTLLLTLWSMKRFRRQPHWAAIPSALAFNAKQSSAPVILLCWAMTLLAPAETYISLKQRLKHTFFFGLIFASITLALNPVLWSDPLRASLAAWEERASLVKEQVAAIRAVNPELVWESSSDRLLGIVAHLYFTPPMIADLKNYLTETQRSTEAYFSQPLHSLFRDTWGGAIFLFLSLFGFTLAAVRVRKSSDSALRYTLTFLWLATALQAIGLIAMVPIPFQRYVVPLIPFQCLWTAKGIEELIRFAKAIVNRSS
jgi:hypothetical protein